MTAPLEPESERFYRHRDERTLDYLGSSWDVYAPVSVEAGDDVCTTPAGQLALLTLVNQLMRFHRVLHFTLSDPDAAILVPAVCRANSLGNEMTRLARRIDPFGEFRVDTRPYSRATVSLGVGVSCRHDLPWYLGFDRCTAESATAPLPLGAGTSSDLRGAGVAALLGASIAMKTVLGMPIVPRRLSAWNFQEGENADPGPLGLPPLDVGRTLMVGAGAVGAGLVYWIMQWGLRGLWTIVDADPVELHNTNRCALFFPDDTDWFGNSARVKSSCLARYLSEADPVEQWYDESPQRKEVFDTVLVLANERNVRTLVSHRNDPIQFQATTGRNWLAQLHRHISGVDGCVHCRMSDFKEPLFKCSEGNTSTEAEPQRPDAALPFLSLASGLMLASALQHLQLGEIGRSIENRWNWDFGSVHKMADDGIRRCRDDCMIVQSSGILQHVAKATRWRNKSWLQPTLS